MVDDLPGEPARQGASARQVLIRRRLLVGLAILIALIALARAVDAPARIAPALAMVRALGAWGHLLFVGLYVVATVLFLPGWPLTLGAGAVFGVVKGIVTVSIGATLGAAVAFLVGRYLARDAVAQRLQAYPRFRSLDRAVARDGWKIVGLARMSPLFPFNVLNYAFGLTQIPLRDYVLASWVGMLPGTAVYVYLGSLAADLTMIGQLNGPRGPAAWALYGGGLAATIAASLYVARVARRGLASATGE